MYYRKWFRPFYKRQELKHNFICCLKCTGQLLFIYISVNQGNLAESFLKIVVYLTFLYLIPYKISHVYLPEMSVLTTLHSYVPVSLSPVQTSKFSLTSFLTSSLTRLYDEQVFLHKFPLIGFICFWVREI